MLEAALDDEEAVGAGADDDVAVGLHVEGAAGDDHGAAGDIAVVGDEAVVSYTRIDDFTDVRTGRPMHVSVRLTNMLPRADDGWKFAPVN